MNKIYNVLDASVKNIKKITKEYAPEFGSLQNPRNGWFEGYDFFTYYSFVRYLKPKKIIEIGCGNSTRVAGYAIKENGKATNITCIDPSPRQLLSNSVTHIQSRVEDVNPEIYKTLGKNDILFIDSSHTKEETEFHINNIFPILKKGVFIHIHDFLTIENRFNEPPMIEGESKSIFEFLIKNKTKYKILICNSWLREFKIDLMGEIFGFKEQYGAGSLWFMKGITKDV